MKFNYTYSLYRNGHKTWISFFLRGVEKTPVRWQWCRRDRFTKGTLYWVRMDWGTIPESTNRVLICEVSSTRFISGRVPIETWLWLFHLAENKTTFYIIAFEYLKNTEYKSGDSTFDLYYYRYMSYRFYSVQYRTTVTPRTSADEYSWSTKSRNDNLRRYLRLSIKNQTDTNQSWVS